MVNYEYEYGDTLSSKLIDFIQFGIFVFIELIISKKDLYLLLS